MCGRFAQVIKHDQLKKLMDELDIKNRDEQMQISYNLAPTQPLGAFFYNHEGRFLSFFRFGLIPSWSKEPQSQYSMINIRAESLLEKKTFKSALLRRRCLIPASGFFEWKKPEKQPYFFFGRDHQPICFAGLNEYWTGADGSFIQSAAIITTDANAVMEPIHDRMPVVLTPDTWQTWLTPSFQDPASLLSMLKPCPDDYLDLYPVTKLCSNVRFNDAACVTPLSR